jgi:hypothetical protein
LPVVAEETDWLAGRRDGVTVLHLLVLYSVKHQWRSDAAECNKQTNLLASNRVPCCVVDDDRTQDWMSIAV